jgi:hypothetical protein
VLNELFSAGFAATWDFTVNSEVRWGRKWQRFYSTRLRPPHLMKTFLSSLAFAAAADVRDHSNNVALFRLCDEQTREIL